MGKRRLLGLFEVHGGSIGKQTPPTKIGKVMTAWRDFERFVTA